MKDFFIFIAGIDKIEYFDFFRPPYFLVFLSRARSRLGRRKIEMGFRVEKIAVCLKSSLEYYLVPEKAQSSSRKKSYQHWWQVLHAMEIKLPIRPTCIQQKNLVNI